MKFRHLVTASALLTLASAAAEEQDMLDFVDPLIGTSDGGMYKL
jgi:hypothetical protein